MTPSLSPIFIGGGQQCQGQWGGSQHSQGQGSGQHTWRLVTYRGNEQITNYTENAELPNPALRFFAVREGSYKYKEGEVFNGSKNRKI